jgi:hypothetical protein
MGEMRRLALVIGFAAAVSLASCSETTAPAPTAPTDLAVTLTSPTSVQLTWTPRPAAEKVARYFVYRNGLRIGETEQGAFAEADLAESVTLAYSVSSATDDGYETAPSQPVAITTRDATPPRVIQNVPLNGAGPLFVENIVVSLVFSEAMDSASINATTFTLKVGPTGEPIPGVIRYFRREHIADFRANHTMPPATTIVVTAAGLKDASGNMMVAPHTFSFTTTENTRPRITQTYPAEGATEVPLDTEVRITFSEPMDVNSLRTRIFDLSSNLPADFVPVSGSWDAATNTQILRGSYKSRHRYEVVVGWSFPAKDPAGNELLPPNNFTFTTLDAGPPVAVSYTPQRDAVGVDPSTPIRITFSEPLDESTLTPSNVVVYRFDGGGDVPGTIAYEPASNTLAYRPAGPLSPATKYVVYVTGLKDATGVPQEENVSLIFTTR